MSVFDDGKIINGTLYFKDEDGQHYTKWDGFTDVTFTHDETDDDHVVGDLRSLCFGEPISFSGTIKPSFKTKKMFDKLIGKEIKRRERLERNHKRTREKIRRIVLKGEPDKWICIIFSDGRLSLRQKKNFNIR